MKTQTQNTIHSIQALRAAAATMVVIFHAVNHLHARELIPAIPRLVDLGRAGVDIFFVISGFIMVWISGNKFGTPGAHRDFIARRIIRVVPIYWMYTLLMTALALAFPHLISQGKTVGIDHFAASLTFIPWENSMGEVKPILSVGWTLNFEMYFYVLFGILLLAEEIYLLPVLSLLLLGGIAAGRMFEGTPAPLYVITSPLLMEFFLGCAIATFYKHDLRIPTGLLILMLAAGICAMVATGLIPTPQLPRAVKWGIPSALIVASLVFLERDGLVRFPALLPTLGNSSYSLYLSHIFTINVVGKLWASLLGSFYGLFIFTATIISIIAGHVSYLVIEKPLTARLNRLYRSRARQSPPSQPVK